ncbi:hypothetical protein ACV22V_30360 [Burkholderia sp. AW33-5]
MTRLRIALLAVAIAAIAVASTYYITHDEDNSSSERSFEIQEAGNPMEAAPVTKVAPPSHGTRSDSFPADGRQSMPEGWK